MTNVDLKHPAPTGKRWADWADLLSSVSTSASHSSSAPLLYAISLENKRGSLSSCFSNNTAAKAFIEFQRLHLLTAAWLLVCL